MIIGSKLLICDLTSNHQIITLILLTLCSFISIELLLLSMEWTKLWWMRHNVRLWFEINRHRYCVCPPDNICKETGVYIIRYVYQLCPSHESSFLIITSCLWSFVYKESRLDSLNCVLWPQKIKGARRYTIIVSFETCCGQRERSLRSQSLPMRWSRPMQPLQTMHNFNRLLKETHADRRVSIQAAIEDTHIFVALHYPRNWIGSVPMDVNFLRSLHMHVHWSHIYAIGGYWIVRLGLQHIFKRCNGYVFM